MLTKLTLDMLDWKSNITHSTWPPTLTSLHLLKDSEFSRLNFPHLPRRLKELVSKSGNWSSVRGDFNAQGRTCLNTIDEQMWSQLKQELYDERDSESDGVRKVLIDKYISEIEDGSLHGLPLTLEHSKLKSTASDRFALSLFPPRLRKVDFGPRFNDTDLCALRAVPLNSITDMTLRANWQDYHWKKPFPDGEAGPLSLKLSRSIVKFSLDLERSHPCDAILQWVPLTLQELRIRARPKIPNSVLKMLPQSLTILWMNCPSETNDWAEVLPRTLKQLYLPMWFLEGPSCSKMPPSLERLVVRVGDGPFTLEQFNELPSSLHHGLLTYDEIAEPEEKNWRIMVHPNPLDDDDVMARNEINWLRVRKYMEQFIAWRASKEAE